MFRNVDRLFNHLASTSEGLGKSSWLRAREERCARRADQARSINCLTGVGVEVPSSATKTSPTGFVLVANHNPTTTERQRPALLSFQKRFKEQSRFDWR